MSDPSSGDQAWHPGVLKVSKAFRAILPYDEKTDLSPFVDMIGELARSNANLGSVYSDSAIFDLYRALLLCHIKGLRIAPYTFVFARRHLHRLINHDVARHLRDNGVLKEGTSLMSDVVEMLGCCYTAVASANLVGSAAKDDLLQAEQLLQAGTWLPEDPMVILCNEEIRRIVDWSGPDSARSEFDELAEGEQWRGVTALLVRCCDTSHTMICDQRTTAEEMTEYILHVENLIALPHRGGAQHVFLTWTQSEPLLLTLYYHCVSRLYRMSCIMPSTCPPASKLMFTIYFLMGLVDQKAPHDRVCVVDFLVDLINEEIRRMGELAALQPAERIVFIRLVTQKIFLGLVQLDFWNADANNSLAAMKYAAHHAGALQEALRIRCRIRPPATWAGTVLGVFRRISAAEYPYVPSIVSVLERLQADGRAQVRLFAAPGTPVMRKSARDAMVCVPTGRQLLPHVSIPPDTPFVDRKFGLRLAPIEPSTVYGLCKTQTCLASVAYGMESLNHLVHKTKATKQRPPGWHVFGCSLDSDPERCIGAIVYTIEDLSSKIQCRLLTVDPSAPERLNVVRLLFASASLVHNAEHVCIEITPRHKSVSQHSSQKRFWEDLAFSFDENVGFVHCSDSWFELVSGPAFLEWVSGWVAVEPCASAADPHERLNNASLLVQREAQEQESLQAKSEREAARRREKKQARAARLRQQRGERDEQRADAAAKAQMERESARVAEATRAVNAAMRIAMTRLDEGLHDDAHGCIVGSLAKHHLLCDAGARTTARRLGLLLSPKTRRARAMRTLYRILGTRKKTPIAETANEPTLDPAEDPTPEPAQEPADEPTLDPAEDPTPEPAQEPADEPTLEPNDEPNDEPIDEPAPAAAWSSPHGIPPSVREGGSLDTFDADLKRALALSVVTAAEDETLRKCMGVDAVAPEAALLDVCQPAEEERCRFKSACFYGLKCRNRHTDAERLKFEARKTRGAKGKQAARDTIREAEPRRADVFECAICMADDSEGVLEKMALHCGHVLCTTCAQAVKTCPKCMAAVTSPPIRVFL